MVELIVALVTVYLVYRFIKWQIKWMISDYNIALTYKGNRATTAEQIEKQRLKDKMIARKLKTKVLGNYLKKPRSKKEYMRLLLEEIEVAQLLKGTKRRMLSELKYEKIKKAAETGKFDSETMDFLNSK